MTYVELYSVICRVVTGEDFSKSYFPVDIRFSNDTEQIQQVIDTLTKREGGKKGYHTVSFEEVTVAPSDPFQMQFDSLDEAFKFISEQE